MTFGQPQSEVHKGMRGKEDQKGTREKHWTGQEEHLEDEVVSTLVLDRIQPLFFFFLHFSLQYHTEVQNQEFKKYNTVFGPE